MPDLHDRIDSLFTDEPEHATGPAVHLRTGRRALRRRRIMTGAGALALVAVLGTTTWAAAGWDDSPRSDPFTATRSADPTDAPTTTPEKDAGEVFADECRAGSGEVLWRAGDAEVMAFAVDWRDQRRAYLRSADQRYWAMCTEIGGEPPYAMVMKIAPNQYSNLGYSYSFGPACAKAVRLAACRYYTISLDGRRDPKVAAIEATFFDGTRERSRTTEGYYLLGRRGRLPAGTAWAPNGMGGELRRNGVLVGIPVQTVRLFDEAGDLLAYHGAEQDVNGINPSNGKGVAELEEYPEIQSDRISR